MRAGRKVLPRGDLARAEVRVRVRVRVWVQVGDG